MNRKSPLKVGNAMGCGLLWIAVIRPDRRTARFIDVYAPFNRRALDRKRSNGYVPQFASVAARHNFHEIPLTDGVRISNV